MELGLEGAPVGGERRGAQFLENVVIQQASLAGFGAWGWKRALRPVGFGIRRQGFKLYGKNLFLDCLFRFGLRLWNRCGAAAQKVE